MSSLYVYLRIILLVFNMTKNSGPADDKAYFSAITHSAPTGILPSTAVSSYRRKFITQKLNDSESSSFHSIWQSSKYLPCECDCQVVNILSVFQSTG